MLTVWEHPHFCFNTQPPKGGWRIFSQHKHRSKCFNTQPPKGGWLYHVLLSASAYLFQHTAA